LARQTSKQGLKREVFKWFNALPLMDVDILNRKNVRAQFEQDFRTTSTLSSVIQKLTETIFELKAKTNVLDINMQLQLIAALQQYTLTLKISKNVNYKRNKNENPGPNIQLNQFVPFNS
jgi:hypothetical protein